MTALDLALAPLAANGGRSFLYIVDGENALTRHVKSIHDVYRACHIETAEAAARASFVLVFRGGVPGTFSKPDMADGVWRNLSALALGHPEQLKAFVCFDENRGFAPKRRGKSECFDAEPGPPSHEKCSIDDAFIVYTALCGSCLFDHIGIVSADVNMFGDLHGYLNPGHQLNFFVQDMSGHAFAVRLPQDMISSVTAALERGNCDPQHRAGIVFFNRNQPAVPPGSILDQYFQRKLGSASADSRARLAAVAEASRPSTAPAEESLEQCRPPPLPTNQIVPRVRSNYQNLSRANCERASACLDNMERSQYRDFTNAVFNVFALVSIIKSHLTHTGCIDSAFRSAPFSRTLRSAVADVLDDRAMLGDLAVAQDKVKSVPGLARFCERSFAPRR